VRVVARLRTEDRCPADPDRRARAAGARPTRALLTPRLLAAAADVAARLGRRGPRTPVGALHVDDLVEQMAAHRAIEHTDGQGDLAGRLLGLIDDRNGGGLSHV